MTSLTLPQIQAELEKLKYNVVWLEDSSSFTLLGRNNPNCKMAAQMTKIEGLLKSTATPDGHYKIKALPAMRSKQQPLTFEYTKGRGDNRPTLRESAENIPSMTPDKVFALMGENATLKAENDALRKQLIASEAREERANEMIEELRGQNQTLSEGQSKGPGILETLSAAAPAIPAILAELRNFIKPPQPQQLAQGQQQPTPQPIAKLLQTIVDNQNAMNVRMGELEARLAEEEEEEEEEEPLTVAELVAGLNSGQYTPDQVNEYLSQYPELKEEYENTVRVAEPA